MVGVKRFRRGYDSIKEGYDDGEMMGMKVVVCVTYM